MFFVNKPSALGSPWILSHDDDKQVVAISKDTVKDLTNYHILGIDFLYQNYRKQFKGAILNEENGMNMRLQVAAFLNAMFNSADEKFLVLIVSPDDMVVNWHYHLKVHSGLKVQIVSHNTCPEDFDQEDGLALILSFSNIKLAEYLVDYDYFSVVIDKFDEVASKLIIKKLTGRFNIGLTERSFYVQPNQKLQWTMLNWSNPGCVGKLADFYEIDNDNFANFRDNYRHWWLRLTWGFCESFKKITFDEKQEYTKNLLKWARANHLNNITAAGKGKHVKKRKKIEMVEDSTENNEDNQESKVEKKIDITGDVHNNGVRENKDNDIKNEDETPIAANSSEETIIYDPADEHVQNRDPKYVDLPSMDEHPILNSIIRNLEKSPEPVATNCPPYKFTPTKYELDQPNCSKAFDDGDVLLSIIDNTNLASTLPTLDHETQMSYKKEELFSQIFNDEPRSPKSVLQTQDDNGFFQSLMEPDDNVKMKTRSGKKRSRNNDVDDILKETEVLLRE